jgi:hypothetical protein
MRIGSEPKFVNLLRSPGIDSQPGRAGTTSLFDVPTSQGGGIDSLESIPGLLKLLQIRAPVRVSQLVESCVESSAGVPGVVRLQVGAGLD